MNLPKDTYMLLSVVNMKLRDSYPSLEALCDDLDVSGTEILEAIEKIGYVYDSENNQFSAK
ncbi:MAG: DUF4250 domain-containing protein [Oscillospiraceae bacterium]|nr:DUF4250 domain-containing protein [Oscillospiraceae bacterium]